MIELKDLQFLHALARQKHFAKAAQECGVSQPAFSMRIRAMEERLGTAIVRRGNRYQGLTPEGEAILRHARRILDDVKFLQQDLLSAKGQITGPLNMGAVPTAAAYAARLAIHLHRSYPGILMRIETTTSLGIQSRIEEGSIDAGITYRDTVSGDVLTVDPLYQERYVLVCPDRMAPRSGGAVAWADLADLPLSLLEPQMQNRRILDRVFEEAGVAPRVISETNALTTAMVLASEGMAATVLPEVLIDALGPPKGTLVLPLTDPVVEKEICMVTAPRDPGLPTVEALRHALPDFPS